MIIDAHAHIFPDKIAKKATDAIGDFYGIQMTESAGTPDVLLQEGRLAGITKFVVHSTATTVKQVESINKYIVSETEAHPEFIGFMTLHPDMNEKDMDGEIRFAISHGIRETSPRLSEVRHRRAARRKNLQNAGRSSSHTFPYRRQKI